MAQWILIYDHAYNNRFSGASSRIEDELEDLQEKYLTCFGINVNYDSPSLYTSYADMYCSTSYSATCSHADNDACTNSALYTDGSIHRYLYHHTNYYNNFLRMPMPDMEECVRGYYFGHDYCYVDNGIHMTNLHFLGSTYKNKGIFMITNFGTRTNETKTLIHEFGHLYGAPDHYDDGGVPSTDEMNEGNEDGPYDRCCIYGEEKSTSIVLQNFQICDGCAAAIMQNRNRFNH